MTDDLRREASDPSTSPGRLKELLLWTTLPAPDEAEQARRLDVRDAVLGNPNVPLTNVRERLLARRPDRHMLAAWFNPAVALWLLGEPSAEYEAAACRLLRWVQGGRQMPAARWGPERGTLASRIAPWAEGREAHAMWEVTPSALTPAQRGEVRAVAARLAGLFGLPWPCRP